MLDTPTSGQRLSQPDVRDQAPVRLKIDRESKKIEPSAAHAYDARSCVGAGRHPSVGGAP